MLNRRNFIGLSLLSLPIPFLSDVSSAQRITGPLAISTWDSGVRANLGRYQDSKHLHFHVSSGDERRR